VESTTLNSGLSALAACFIAIPKIGRQSLLRVSLGGTQDAAWLLQRAYPTQLCDFMVNGR
jgi:hypothetical protein